MIIRLKRAAGLKGVITPPPDKSISHRAVLFSSIAKGKGVIRNFLRAADTTSTLNAMRSLGVEISEGGAGAEPTIAELTIEGKGLLGLREPLNVIDCGNSGTTIRLIAGMLAGNPFFSVLTGDGSLRSRPMGRVITPLAKMGARIMARGGDKYPPMAIRGGGLSPVRYEMPVASAQLKSAIILAGLYARGETEIIEPVKSRDHTERMLRACGANIAVEGLRIKIRGGGELEACDFTVPGDFSSAAFFIAAALLVEGSELVIKGVGVNPARTGFLTAIQKMGALVDVENPRELSGEPVADLHCRHSELKAIDIEPGMIPSLIDELPVLCVLASQAEGITTIRGAEELRVKESDRIESMADGLIKMGAEVKAYEDGLSIKGRRALRGAGIDSFGDHRVAMSFAVASLVADGETSIEGAEAVDISFPGFFDKLKTLTG